MCHWTVWLIKINTFNIHASEQSPSLILGATSERRTFFPSGRDFIGMGAERRLTFYSCHIEQKELLSRIFSEDCLNLHQYSLVWEVSLGDELQDVKPQVWLDQIWSESLQDLFFVLSSLYINWSWSWIYNVELYENLFHQVHLDLL